MAGNTRFMGFGNEDRIQLARWGSKVMVKLPPEATVALRKAVYEELPKAPKVAKKASAKANKIKSLRAQNTKANKKKAAKAKAPTLVVTKKSVRKGAR